MSTSRFEALLEVLDRIAGTRDLQELVRLLAPVLRKAVEFDYVAVFLYDPEKDLMILHSVERFFDRTPPQVHMPPEKTPAGLCFLTQKHVIMDDVQTESRFDADVIGMMRDYGTRSVCYQPLTSSVRRLGTLSFGSLEPRKFAESEMPFLLQIAHQVAVAIDNALHFEEAQRYQKSLSTERDRLRLLLEVNNAIASRLELHDFLEAVSRCLQRILSNEMVSISLYEAEDDQLRLYSLVFPGGHGLIREGMTMPVKDTVLGRVLTSRKPLRLTGLPDDAIPADIRELA